MSEHIKFIEIEDRIRKTESEIVALLEDLQNMIPERMVLTISVSEVGSYHIGGSFRPYRVRIKGSF